MKFSRIRKNLHNLDQNNIGLIQPSLISVSKSKFEGTLIKTGIQYQIFGLQHPAFNLGVAPRNLILIVLPFYITTWSTA